MLIEAGAKWPQRADHLPSLACRAQSFAKARSFYTRLTAADQQSQAILQICLGSGFDPRKPAE